MRFAVVLLAFAFPTLIWASPNLAILQDTYGNPLYVLSSTMLQLLPKLQYPKESLQKYKSPLSSSKISAETGLPENHKEDDFNDLINNKINSQIRRLKPLEVEADDSDLRQLFDHFFLAPAQQFLFDKDPDQSFLISNIYDDPIQKLETLRKGFVADYHRLCIKRGSKSWDQLDLILTTVYNFFLSSTAKHHHKDAVPIEHFLPIIKSCSSALGTDSNDSE